MKRKIWAVGLAIGIIALIYFGLSTKPPKISAYDTLQEKLIDSLQYPNGSDLLQMHSDMLDAEGGSKSALLQQLSEEWLTLGQPSISADYLRWYADNEPSYENYMAAGAALAAVIDFEKDDNIRVNVVYGARYCYEQAGKLKEGDLEAEIGEASVLVSGTNNPMEGILKLRKIDSENPGNVKVNLELGRFSIMSGQFDKALERFGGVLQKDSLNLQARYMMAQTYLGLKDTTAAIAQLEKLQSLTTDKMIIDQVDVEIKNLNH